MGDGRESRREDERPSIKTGYGDVAPKLNQDAYSRAEEPSPPPRKWRAGYGEVAPAFTDNVKDGQNQSQGGNQGGTGEKPWRAGYGEVAPAFKPGQQNPNDRGGRAGYGEVAPVFDPNRNGAPSSDTPVWKPKPLPEATAPTRREQAQTGDSTAGSQSEMAREKARQEWKMGKNFDHFMYATAAGGVGGVLSIPLSYSLSYGAKRVLAHVPSSCSV